MCILGHLVLLRMTAFTSHVSNVFSRVCVGHFDSLLRCVARLCSCWKSCSVCCACVHVRFEIKIWKLFVVSASMLLSWSESDETRHSHSSVCACVCLREGLLLAAHSAGDWCKGAIERSWLWLHGAGHRTWSCQATHCLYSVSVQSTLFHLSFFASH